MHTRRGMPVHARVHVLACHKVLMGGKQKHLESEALSRQAVDAEHDEMCFSKNKLRARQCSSGCIALLDARESAHYEGVHVLRHESMRALLAGC